MLKRQEGFSFDISFDEALERFSRVSTEELVEPQTPSKKPTPFIKWVGGKRHLLSELTSRIPPRFNTYYEPFLGGAALFFEASSRINNAILSDTNLELVITFNAVKKDPDKLMALLEEHASKHDSDYYYRVRSQHDIQDPLKIAARFIYLNKTCYNGLYRVNKSGQFNVPIGRYSVTSIFDKENIIACSKALQKAKIGYSSFVDVEPESGAFVYCDPPYHPLNTTASFTEYTKSEFKEAEQTGLRDFALRMAKKGVYIMISNSDTEFIRSLYSCDPFKIEVVQAPRYVNCKPTRRGLINELIITTY